MSFSTTARPLRGGAPAPDRARHEDLFRLVTDNLTDHCIFVLDTDGAVETWSACAERLTGYAEAEAVGRSIAFLNLPLSEGDGGHLNALAEARTEGRCEAKRVWVAKDGRHVPVEEVTTPLRDDGELVGYVIIARDLGRRQDAGDEGGAESAREARSELATADRRAAFLAEASSILVASSLNFEAAIKSLARLAVSRLADWCVIYAVGDDGQVRRIEAAHGDPRQEGTLRQLLGGALEKRRQHPILSVIQTGQSELLEEVPDTVMAALASDADQLEILRELGMRSAIFTPLIARGRALGGLTLVSTRPEHTYDDDDLKLAEELARRAAIAIDNARLYREAQEANRAKADFLAIVSHELRTPLNAIMGYSDLLDTGVSGPVTQQQRRQLGRVRASARHLLQLIEEILSYARIESGGAEVELRDGTIDEMAEDALAVIEPLAVAKNLHLTKLVERGGTTLRTDGAKVRQVLVNLLSNAVKFTDHGHIELLAGTRGDRAFFTIRDTGVGIGAEQLGKIFDAFWQVERPNTRRVGGTGLGLSVAQRFARLLRGELTVQSEAGRGSAFTLTLPLSYEQAAGAESAAA